MIQMLPPLHSLFLVMTAFALTFTKHQSVTQVPLTFTKHQGVLQLSSGEEVIVDSGTTLAYLPNSVYMPLMNEVNAIIIFFCIY